MAASKARIVFSGYLALYPRCAIACGMFRPFWSRYLEAKEAKENR